LYLIAPGKDKVRFHHIPSLDGLRGLAVMLVLFAHTQPQLLRGGQNGVDLFFVLSGFLITSILLREHDSTDEIHLLRFYARRALRLWPALFIVIVGVVCYAMIWESAEKFEVTLGDAISALAYYWNWRTVFVWKDIANHQWMLFHLWSLSVEEQFYIVWPPMLALLLGARLRGRTVIYLVISAIAAVFILRIYLWCQDRNYPLYFRTDARADALLFGVLVAFLVREGVTFATTKARTFLNFCCVTALAFIAYDSTKTPDVTLQVWGQLSLLALSSALLIVGAVRGFPEPLNWLFNLGPLRWIGTISYGLYLYHWPIFYRLRDYDMQPNLRMVLSFALAFVIATLSYYFVEKPFLRLKDRLGSRAGVVESVSA
jgi:peptidoglycan/LPS O-acetylase OafA/YrhL